MWVRGVIVFVIVFAVFAVNMPESVFARLGLEPNYLIAAAVAALIALLVASERSALAVVVVLLAIAANLPGGVAEQYHIDPDIALATLIAVVLVPVINHYL